MHRVVVAANSGGGRHRLPRSAGNGDADGSDGELVVTGYGRDS
jgi:hypothetical protein